MFKFIRFIAIFLFLLIISFTNSSISQLSTASEPNRCSCIYIPATLYTNGPCYPHENKRHCWFNFFYTNSQDSLLSKYSIKISVDVIYKIFYDIYSKEGWTEPLYSPSDVFEALFVYSLPKEIMDNGPKVAEELLLQLRKVNKRVNDIFIGYDKRLNRGNYEDMGYFAVGKLCFVAKLGDVRISVSANKAYIDGKCPFKGF